MIAIAHYCACISTNLVFQRRKESYNYKKSCVMLATITGSFKGLCRHVNHVSKEWILRNLTELLISHMLVVLVNLLFTAV